MAPLSCYGVGAFSLPIPYDMHLVTQLSFACLGGVSSQQDTSPKKALAGTSKKVFPSPYYQTMPSYLWPMTSLCPILVRYRLVRLGPCACLPSMYVQKSACCSLAFRGLEACLYSLPLVLWPFMWAFFDFPLPLGADIYLLLGFTLFLAHFLIAPISYHITLSFLQ